MAVRQYIGARYVPMFYENSDNNSDWRDGVEYEPLTIVSYNGNSYTSKRKVPSTIGNPSANPRYWQVTGVFNIQIQEILNKLQNIAGNVGVCVSDYGAVGDGVTDDTAAIQNAINENNAVYFEAGKTYKISRLNLHSNLDFNLNGATLYYIIDSAEAHNFILYALGCNNIRIHHGTITTDYLYKLNVDTQVVGFVGNSCSYIEVDHIKTTNLGTAINTVSGHTHFSFPITVNSVGDVHDCIVHDCEIDSIYDDFGIRFASSFASSVPLDYECYNCFAFRNHIKYAKKSAIEILGSFTHHCASLWNIVDDCGTEAMDIDKDAYYCAIIANEVIKCSGNTEEIPTYVPYGGISVQSYTGTGAYVDKQGHDNIVMFNYVHETLGNAFFFSGVENCKCAYNITGKCKNGIWFNSYTDGQFDYKNSCEVHDNTIYADEQGIGCQLKLKCNIHHNKIVAPVGIRSANVEGYIKIVENEINFTTRGIYDTSGNVIIVQSNHVEQTGTPSSQSNLCNIFTSNTDYMRVEGNTTIEKAGFTTYAMTLGMSTKTNKLAVVANNNFTNTHEPFIQTGTFEKVLLIGNSNNVTRNQGVVITSLKDLQF